MEMRDVELLIDREENKMLVNTMNTMKKGNTGSGL